MYFSNGTSFCCFKTLSVENVSRWFYLYCFTTGSGASCSEADNFTEDSDFDTGDDATTSGTKRKIEYNGNTEEELAVY